MSSRHGLKRAAPVALVAVPAYLFAAAFASFAIDSGGPGWLNVVVMLFIWDACKFAALPLINLLSVLRRGLPSPGHR